MNTEKTNTDIAPTTSRRRLTSALVGIVAIVGLSACNSDPGPGRVAEDIVNTAFEQGEITAEERDCMLEKIGAYSDDELKAIEESANDAGPGTALDQYEADLAACR